MFKKTANILDCGLYDHPAQKRGDDKNNKYIRSIKELCRTTLFLIVRVIKRFFMEGFFHKILISGAPLRWRTVLFHGKVETFLQQPPGGSEIVGGPSEL